MEGQLARAIEERDALKERLQIARQQIKDGMRWYDRGTEEAVKGLTRQLERAWEFGKRWEWVAQEYVKRYTNITSNYTRIVGKIKVTERQAATIAMFDGNLTAIIRIFDPLDLKVMKD